MPHSALWQPVRSKLLLHVCSVSELILPTRAYLKLHAFSLPSESPISTYSDVLCRSSVKDLILVAPNGAQSNIIKNSS